MAGTTQTQTQSPALAMLQELSARVETYHAEYSQALQMLTVTVSNLDAHVTELLRKQPQELPPLAAAKAPAYPAQPPAQQAGSNVNGVGGTAEFDAVVLVMTIDEKGQPSYKIKGEENGPYGKFGVRVWPEMLPQIGVNAAELKPGANEYHGRVRVLLSEEGKARKVIGLAA